MCPSRFVWMCATQELFLHLNINYNFNYDLSMILRTMLNYYYLFKRFMVSDWLTQLTVKSSYQLNDLWSYEYSTEWRHDIDYEKIISNVMTLCNGKTNTKCRNTTKTIWRRLRLRFLRKGNNFKI
jgi:hypothetical protein